MTTRRRSQGRASGPVYLTTHQVSRIFGVSLPTVVNWVKAGRMLAHKTPGGHRRIAREELQRFASVHDYPLPDEMSGVRQSTRVLIIDGERDFAELIGEYLEIKAGMEVRSTDDLLWAGFELGAFRPDVVLVALGTAELDGWGFARMLQERPETKEIRVVACTAFPGGADASRAIDEGFVASISRTDPLDRVLRELRKLTDR